MVHRPMKPPAVEIDELKGIASEARRERVSYELTDIPESGTLTAVVPQQHFACSRLWPVDLRRQRSHTPWSGMKPGARHKECRAHALDRRSPGAL